MQITTTILALGANKVGVWGSPEATLKRACQELERLGFSIRSQSTMIRTHPIGSTRQPDYHNLAISIDSFLPIVMFLKRLKSIEYAAGRRTAARWSARELDIDIICHGGRVTKPLSSRCAAGLRRPRVYRGQSAVARADRRGPGTNGTLRGRLQLPHPEMHRRSFVLEPMLEVAPHWRHPIGGLTVRAMLLQLGIRRPRHST
jgi:2-amino-4-hydroxy-6-hydroxymethyldihydropteridine diphosphokinase